jgi:tetratricopeptide (TPR) repeat protein
MDASQIDALVQRLVTNPHDEEALTRAHQAGAADPKSYALLLERVGAETRDPAYASHWLSEAANVWSTTLGDAHRAARVLMQAIDRDPTQRTAADRLAQLYRDKGDIKALVALLERRAKALAPLAAQSAEIRSELAGMHEELGRLWNDSLQQPKKALENYRRAIDLEPASPFSIFGAREIYKSLGQWDDAFQMYEAELAIERDPQRQLALLNDEVAARRAASDLAGATRALGRARQVDPQDPALQQQYGALIVERLAAGDTVSVQDKTAGAELLVGLAEAYDGEHGLAYSAGALDIDAGHDRALQLYTYYARALQREDDVSVRYLAYIDANPTGAMASDARWLLAASYEAANQIENAIQILEPLRGLGDPQATAKVGELYARIGRQMPAELPPPPQPRAPAASTPPVEVGRSPSNVGMRRNAVGADRVQGLLDAAQALASRGKRAEAYQKYREVLEADSAHPEALSWVEDYLRTKRDYGALRDVLLAAVRAGGESVETRKERLREVAGLCEGNLRDVDGAINAWKQLLAIDRVDDGARQSLTRLLEKSHRWDDLANLLEQEATAESDLEKKIALEKKLATLHELKRRDLGAAAEAWARIAILTPEDDRAVATASKMFEKTGALDRAAQVISENVASITDLHARGALLERLGEMREQAGDSAGAADSYAEAAEAQKNAKLWEAAERCFVAAEKWSAAAGAAAQRAELANEAKQQAQHLARAAGLFGRAGDDANLISNLERAVDLDPTSEPYAAELQERYTAGEKWSDLVQLLLKRGERLTDKTERVAARRQAANLYASKLSDKEGARETWLKVLEDGDDKEALEKLVDDAIERADHTEATTLLRRLGNAVTDRAEHARIALREAEILAEGVGDIEAAISLYERIVSELDPACRPALQAIADLQEARDNLGAATDALERELRLVEGPVERGQIAARLARLYEQLDDAKNAIRTLEIVRKGDPEDFEALSRLCDLCEKTEEWDKVAELLAQRIEFEADEGEMSVLTKKLANVLSVKLDRGDEALAALTELADMGDASCRAAYVDLGDRLGWRGIVATKLVEWWFEAKASPERTSHLRGAFERFAEVGRDQDAVKVACEIVRSKGADRALADHLEQLSVKTSDLDALAIAHDLLAREMSGLDRARELVRQAEARVQAGAPRLEALQHGEAGLTSVPPGDAEELLVRLAAIAEKPSDIVDLYERQITRCKAPADRVKALGRAAQVAAAQGQGERARGFFELALGGTPSDETLGVLESAARDGDSKAGGDDLRRALCASMAAGGQGARDGGRTRGALMRRAASMARRDLNDIEQAFALLGDALIAYVEPATLDALEGLAHDLGDLRRAEATLSRALGEVFDGPLVRQLYARRAKLRREHLDDKQGAAADLKKLHDLTPSDQAVMDELSALLTELGDYRGMVQLYEDHILRGKDMAARAELARKVARMWEEQLADPREAADAWRRVLRMKQGDPEAAAGLERAKSNMLKKPEPGAEREAYAPPKLQSVSLPPPAEPRMTSTAPPATETAPPKAEPAIQAVSQAQSQAESVEPPPDADAANAAAVVAEEAPTPQPQEPADELPATIVSADVAGEADAPVEGGPTLRAEEINGEQRTPAGAVDHDERRSRDDRPSRPRELFFNTSPDEITVSSPGAVESDLASLPSGTDDDDALEGLDALDRVASDDDSIVREVHARPAPGADATESMPARTSTEPPDPAGQTIDAPRDQLETSGARDFEEEVIIADDLAEMIDIDEAEPVSAAEEAAAALPAAPPEPANEPKKKKRKRSIPPPVPRS